MTLGKKEIQERVSLAGWNLQEMGEDGTIILTCDNNHKFVTTTRNLSKATPCSYCSGIKVTPQGLVDKAKTQGFSLPSVDGLVTKTDRSGNVFVPKNSRVTFICGKGHEQVMSINELEKGKQCTACKQTRANTAYSRSEEIIAGVLDHLGIKYIRQAVTDTLHEQLKLDFLLPEIKVIIEYDGSHHKYGRTTDRGDNLEEIKRKDSVRDAYAESIGYKMVRLNHHQVGRKLIYSLAKELPELHLNPSRPDYDEIVRDVYNYASTHFGWDSYEKIKSFADMYKSMGRVEAHKRTGRSMSNLQRDYNTIYGIPKK